MQSLIADTLRAWREAERLMHRLSPADADHEMVRHLVIELRTMYARLSESRDVPEGMMASAQALLASANDLFDRLHREPEGQHA